MNLERHRPGERDQKALEDADVGRRAQCRDSEDDDAEEHDQLGRADQRAPRHLGWSCIIPGCPRQAGHKDAARAPAEDGDGHSEDDGIGCGLSVLESSAPQATSTNASRKLPATAAGRLPGPPIAGDEPLEHRIEARRRDDVRDDGEKNARRSGKEPRYGEGADDDGVGANAHQLGDREVVRGGAHGKAEDRTAQEHRQHDDYEDRRDQRDDIEKLEA